MLHSQRVLPQGIVMTNKFAFLFTTAALLGATPAMAQTVCVEPTPPTMVDGKTANHDQVLALVTQTKDFVAKSDTYQSCIGADLDTKKAAAAKGGAAFDEQVHQVAMAKVAANQQLKDKLVADTNIQVAFYKQQTSKK
jgi:hypothetical protein